MAYAQWQERSAARVLSSRNQVPSGGRYLPRWLIPRAIMPLSRIAHKLSLAKSANFGRLWRRERYRRGRNGSDSKSDYGPKGCTWVRIPPSPPAQHLVSTNHGMMNFKWRVCLRYLCAGALPGGAARAKHSAECSCEKSSQFQPDHCPQRPRISATMRSAPYSFRRPSMIPALCTATARPPSVSSMYI